MSKSTTQGTSWPRSRKQQGTSTKQQGASSKVARLSLTSRYLFTTANSPLSTRRVYRFDVYGSKDSLLPRICAVDAVGMGASSSELRTPCSAISARRPVLAAAVCYNRP